MLFFVFILFFGELNETVQAHMQLDEMTKNLIANFRVDPNVLSESSSSKLSETSKEFIDKHIKRYSQLMLTSQQKEFYRSKGTSEAGVEEEDRSETQDCITDIKSYKHTPLPSTADMRFFQQHKEWYLAILESDTGFSDIMKILKYQEEKFVTVEETDIQNGLRVATFPFDNFTLIVVAENFKDMLAINIYQFDFHEHLKVIQKIDGRSYTDVTLWEDNGNVFMSLVGFMRNSTISTSSVPRVYKWHGRHFDVLQDIQLGVTSISPFSIGDSGFVALANNAPADGDENDGVYSQILKYNLNTEKYELFQMILTYGCDDIKYFEIDTVDEMGNVEKGRFLIVANFYKKDLFGKNEYKVPSIIYRFMDNYFFPFQSIVLNGARRWEIMKVENGNVLMVALTLDGLRTFTYDGWYFKECITRFEGLTEKDDMKDVETMHLFEVNGIRLLVTPRTESTASKSQIFEVQYTRKDKLKQQYDSLLVWCQKTTKTLENRRNILEQNGKDVSDELKSDSQKKTADSETLARAISEQLSTLAGIEKKLFNSIQSINSHVVEKNITAIRIRTNAANRIKFLHTKTLNGIKIDSILNNVLNIKDGFQFESELKIDFVQAEASLFPKKFNNHSTDQIIYLDQKNELKNVIINGSAIFEDDVTIHTINDVIVNINTAKPVTGKEHFRILRSFQTYMTGISKETTRISDTDTDASSAANESSGGSPEEKVKHFEELKAKNLIVGGFINDVYIPTLEKYALRKAGKQDITKTYYFDQIEMEQLDTDFLSNIKIPEDLVTIKDKIKIQEPVTIDHSLKVNSLFVKKRLNDISVTKTGDLRILRKNQTHPQYVTGSKTFENLTISNSIGIQNKIKSKEFEKFDPLVTISGNLTIDVDVNITGEVLVEKILKSIDIIPKGRSLDPEIKLSTRLTEEKQLIADTPEAPITLQITKREARNTDQREDNPSILRVLKEGIKLQDENFEVPVQFLEQVYASEVQIESINGVDLSQVVSKKSGSLTEITGHKTFEGNLQIIGDTIVHQINDIVTDDLENILQKNKDQTIDGKHRIKHVVISGRLLTNNTKLGEHLWKDVVTIDSNQTINGTITLKNLKANFTSIKNIRTHGKVNEKNVSAIFDDLVQLDTNDKISGTKHFQTLNITHLHLDNFDLDALNRDLEANRLVLDGIDDFEVISAENLFFGQTINRITKEELDSLSKLDQNVLSVVEDEYEFETIKVWGSVFIQDNRLNQLDMDDFENETVKIDEPFHFENAEFEKELIVAPLVSHHGDIEKLDLENIFENGKTEIQTILDIITFREDLTINGTLHINGSVNGADMAEICGIRFTDKEVKKLIVAGNVQFTKGPNIQKINGKRVKDFEEHIWYTDTPMSLFGNVLVDGNVTLRDSLTIEGLLNDVKIENISTNYLSKTKDQHIEAHVNLLNTTFFKRDLSTPEITVRGYVNDIKLEEFIRNTLLHRPQLFENLVYFEEFTANHSQGNYMLNKLNLDSEVMRYDRPNLITGTKTFRNLDVDVMRPERETPTAKVQEVDVEQWLREAVLNEGNFQLKGTKTFEAVDVKEAISLVGDFNGMKFNKENVLMKGGIQNVTGKKTFVSSSGEIKFKKLNVEGFVNGERLERMLENQANINEDITINTSLQFCNVISAENVIFNKKYSNIDVPELLQNITTLGTLNHIEENYKNLQDMADEVEKSLKAQAYFLDYYKPVPMEFEMRDIFPLMCPESDSRILSFRNEGGSNVMKSLDWDESNGIFLDKREDTNIGTYPNYIKKVQFEGLDRIYLEHEIVTADEVSDGNHEGGFIRCNGDSINLEGVFRTQGTLFVSSFEIKSQSLWCLLFLDFKFRINIPCSGPDGRFEHHQVIESKTLLMASVAMFEDRPVLVTIQKEHGGESTVWTMNKNNKFEPVQTDHEGDAISVSMLPVNDEIFLAIAFKHVPNTKDFGKVVVKRFRKSSKSFHIFQTININNPSIVELALLPSDEISLYVVTENPLEPMVVYVYNGIAGFVQKIGSLTIPIATNIRTFSIKNQHFVVVKHATDMNVLQAVFKGSR